MRFFKNHVGWEIKVLSTEKQNVSNKCIKMYQTNLGSNDDALN